MSWYLLAAIHVIAITGYTLAQRFALRDQKYQPTPFAIGLLYFAVLTSFSIAAISGTLDLEYAKLPAQAVFITLAFNTMQMIVISRALSMTEASVFSIITTTRVLIMITLSIIFLDDSLSLNVILGAIAVTTGAVLVVYEKGQKFQLNKGVFYSLLAAIAVGVPYVSDLFALTDDYDPASYLGMVWLIPALILTVIRPKDSRLLARYAQNKDFLWKAFLPGFLLSVSIIALLKAFQDANNPSVLAIVSQISTVLVVLSSIVLLGEKKQLLLKLVASAIAFSGLVLVNL